MAYTPTMPPEGTPPELAQWLREELVRLARSFFQLDKISFATQYVEPARPRPGDVVLADGVEWDPGAGAGFYGYRGGAWVKLG